MASDGHEACDFPCDECDERAADAIHVDPEVCVVRYKYADAMEKLIEAEDKARFAAEAVEVQKKRVQAAKATHDAAFDAAFKRAFPSE